jgi:hypothetical protein
MQHGGEVVDLASTRGRDAVRDMAAAAAATLAAAAEPGTAAGGALILIGMFVSTT